MRQTFPILLLIIISFITPVFAQESRIAPNDVDQSVIFPPIPPRNSFPFGQRHYYSVFFRGNGQAVVLSRLIIPNPSDKTLGNFQFQITDATPDGLIIYQQVLPRRCLRYVPVRPLPDSAFPEVLPNRCLEYADPDYDWPAADYGGAGSQPTYHRLQPQINGNLVTIDFKEKVPPQKTTALIIFYRTFGYADKKLFGLFHFNFKTFRVPTDVETAKVAVSVDEGLHLKTGRAQVDYQADGMRSLTAGLSEAVVSSPAFSKHLTQIGQIGQIMKQTQNLAPNETFAVAGQFSQSPWRLYLGPAVLSLIIIFFIFVALFLLAKFLSRPLRAKMPQASKKVLEIASLSFLSSAFLTTFVIFLSFLPRSPDDLLGPVFHQPAVIFFLFLLSTLFVLIVVATPPLIVGLRHGVLKALITLLAQFLWLFLFFLLWLVFFALSPENLLTSLFSFWAGQQKLA